MDDNEVDSVRLGRKPSPNPLAIQIAFRVDNATADALDAEIEHEAKPGWRPTRGDMARILFAEALVARRWLRKKPTPRAKR